MFLMHFFSRSATTSLWRLCGVRSSLLWSQHSPFAPLIPSGTADWSFSTWSSTLPGIFWNSYLLCFWASLVAFGGLSSFMLTLLGAVSVRTPALATTLSLRFWWSPCSQRCWRSQSSTLGWAAANWSLSCLMTVVCWTHRNSATTPATVEAHLEVLMPLPLMVWGLGWRGQVSIQLCGS